MYIPRLRLDPPFAWMEKYPEEICVFEGESTDPEVIRELVKQGRVNNTYDMTVEPRPNGIQPLRLDEPIGLQSFSSKKWLRDAEKALEAVINHVMSGPHKDRFAGFHICFGGTCELLHWGNGGERIGDFSTKHTAAFYDWAIAKYGSHSALCEAWQTPDLTREGFSVPSASAPKFIEETELPLSAVRFSIDKDNFAHPEMHHVRGDLAERILAAHRAANPARVCFLAAEASDENSVLCRAPSSPYLPEKGKRDFFGWSPIDKKGPAPGETVVCVYDFALAEPLSALSVVCDPEWQTTYYLNGERLVQTSAERIWHYANPVYDISGIAEVGKNRLVAVCTLPTYKRAFPLPAPVLKGDFRIFSDFVLTAKSGQNGFGYWNDKGYICYGGDGTYETAFSYSGEGKLLLSLDTKDTVCVLVNGKKAGVRYAAPYEVDITEYAKKGENTLTLRVTSTLSNFIYKSSPSGLRSAKLICKN